MALGRRMAAYHLRPCESHFDFSDSWGSFIVVPLGLLFFFKTWEVQVEGSQTEGEVFG